MKVIILIFHILCVIVFGACTILANNLFSEIMYLICTSLHGMLVGMDIANLIFDM